MKMVLVDNLLFEGDIAHPRFDLQPHLGLMSLSSILKANGIKPIIYDPKREIAKGHLRFDGRIYSAVASRIAALDADVVGFTTLGCNFPFVVRVAQLLKRRR